MRISGAQLPDHFHQWRRREAHPLPLIHLRNEEPPLPPCTHSPSLTHTHAPPIISMFHQIGGGVLGRMWDQLVISSDKETCWMRCSIKKTQSTQYSFFTDSPTALDLFLLLLSKEVWLSKFTCVFSLKRSSGRKLVWDRYSLSSAWPSSTIHEGEPLLRN